MGAGLALPYALAPRLALSALPPAQAGQGSGIVNACTFMGGSVGVAGGSIAFAAGRFAGGLIEAPPQVVIETMRWMPRPAFRTAIGLGALALGLRAAGRRAA